VTNKIKWGVIGSGGIALRRTIPEGIVPAWNAELAVVYDVNQRVNDEVARKFGAQAATSFSEVLTAELDAVYIATPAHLHHDQVLECARARRHVLCEKPLGMTVAEADEMVAACRQAGIQFGTAFMMRFHSQHQAALQIVQEGKLGKLVYGRAQLSCWYPPIEGAWRQNPTQGGGGSLIDMGGHSIDLLEMYFGPVAKVSCFVHNSVQNYRPEDSAVALLLFENGAIATVDAFFCIPDEASENALELYGSKGSIIARGTIGQASQGKMFAHLKESVGGYDAAQARDSADAFEIAPVPVNMYRAEIEDFSQALQDGRPSALTGEAGLRSQKILSACYESARTGKVCSI
jgi:predicted dehydrogenase